MLTLKGKLVLCERGCLRRNSNSDSLNRTPYVLERQLGDQNAYSEFATLAAFMAARLALRARAACFFLRRTLGFSKYLRRRDSVNIPCCCTRLLNRLKPASNDSLLSSVTCDIDYSVLFLSGV